MYGSSQSWAKRVEARALNVARSCVLLGLGFGRFAPSVELLALYSYCEVAAGPPEGRSFSFMSSHFKGLSGRRVATLPKRFYSHHNRSGIGTAVSRSVFSEIEDSRETLVWRKIEAKTKQVQACSNVVPMVHSSLHSPRRTQTPPPRRDTEPWGENNVLLGLAGFEPTSATIQAISGKSRTDPTP